MNCPDWPAAAAWRHGDGAAPPGWQASLEHLAGCAACRRRVGALDPTLLLAAAAAPAPAVGEEEAGAIRATVRSLVAAERLGSRRRSHGRALAAAAAIAVLLVVPLGLGRLAQRPAAPPAPPESVATLLEPAEEPPVEEVQPAGARVYHFGTDELPVVFIFDESLDL